MYMCGGVQYTPYDAWQIFRRADEAEHCYIMGEQIDQLRAGLRGGIQGEAVRLIDELVAERLEQQPLPELILGLADTSRIAEALSLRPAAVRVKREEVWYVARGHILTMLPTLSSVHGNQPRTISVWWAACAAEIEQTGGRLEEQVQSTEWRALVFRRFLTPELWAAWSEAFQRGVRDLPVPPDMLHQAAWGYEFAVAYSAKMQWVTSIDEHARRFAAGAKRRRSEIWP